MSTRICSIASSPDADFTDLFYQIACLARDQARFLQDQLKEQRRIGLNGTMYSPAREGPPCRQPRRRGQTLTADRCPNTQLHARRHPMENMLRGAAIFVIGVAVGSLAIPTLSA
jgi:hypothetical protein